MLSLSFKRYHVVLTSPTRSSQAAGVSIPNAPFIFRIWRSPLCQRLRRCDSPLQLRAAADRDSTLGKGQEIRAKGLLAQSARIKEAAHAKLESHSLLTTSLAVLRPPFRASSCFLSLCSTHSLTQVALCSSFEHHTKHLTLIYIALRLVLIARRVHHLNNTRLHRFTHFDHAPLFFPGRSCGPIRDPCLCSDILFL